MADGRLSLSSARALAPVLTADNQVRLLDAAAFKSKRAVELLVVAERPQPPVASSVRKLPVHSPATSSAPDSLGMLVMDARQPAAPVPTAVEHPTPAMERPARSAVAQPLSRLTYKVQFTLSSEEQARLRRAQDLMRHTNASGDVALVFERALALLVEELERGKFAAARRPRPGPAAPSRSRHVPSEVKRKVWSRDGGQCAFVGTEGRCTETGFLEYHHVMPFADGGETSVENLQLRCAAHNAYESMLWSGDVVREQ